MSFQNDAYSLNFDELYKKHPNRRVPVYRYKVANFKSTLNKIIVKPRRSIILLLEEETLLQAVQDTYSSVKTTITISSNQSSGSQEMFNNETITLITGELLPTDYRDEFYIYSLTKIANETLSSDELFMDQIGSSVFPDFQLRDYKGSKDELSKITNVLILNKIKINTTGTSVNIYSYIDETIDYFDANKNIILKLSGVLGEFETSYWNNSFNKRQMEYNLLENDNHKYALIQMTPTKIRPNITFSSDTYDRNKNLSFDKSSRFIGEFIDIGVIWRSYGFEPDALRDRIFETAESSLYWAFLTIVFLANERLTKFENYRIDDKNSVNYQKINTEEMKKWLYKVDLSNILNVEQKEFTAIILKTWEQEWTNDLYRSNKLKSLYQDVKGILASLSEYIPSQFSFGNYQKIGNVALEWFMTPKTMKLVTKDDKGNIINNIEKRSAFLVQVESLKYVFDLKKRKITGLTPKFLKVSGVRTFELDGFLTLPSIPETLSEENKNTTAGEIDTSNTNFLNYTWIFQINDISKYEQIFNIEDPFTLKDEHSNEWFGIQSRYPPFIDLSKNTPDAGVVRYTGPEVEKYIVEYLMFSDREIISGSGGCTLQIYPDGTTLFGSYDWKEKQRVYGIPIITPPFSINSAQWEQFENSIGTNLCEYILQPIIKSGKNTSIRKLNDIQWKSTLSNYAEITLPAKLKNDAGAKDVVFRIDLTFKKDQTAVQEGVLI